MITQLSYWSAELMDPVQYERPNLLSSHRVGPAFVASVKFLCLQS